MALTYRHTVEFSKNKHTPPQTYCQRFVLGQLVHTTRTHRTCQTVERTPPRPSHSLAARGSSSPARSVSTVPTPATVPVSPSVRSHHYRCQSVQHAHTPIRALPARTGPGDPQCAEFHLRWGGFEEVRGALVGVVGPPFFCVWLCSAVSYSPTPWRVQYHRRWRA